VAQPTPYDRQYSFSAFQQSSPSDPLPANRIDAEYNAIKVTLDQILNNLALIQRDDGELQNNSVGVEQIDESVELGFSEPTVWATTTVYGVGDCVFESYKFYICETAHTAGTFATDLSAGKWGEIADFTAVFADASGYADAAAASASTASTKASEASASAAAALVSQNAAAASAVTAAGYASAYKGTSTSSVAIATGSKGFTTQSGKFFDVGAWVLIVSAANSANYMHGYVTAYSGTSLTVEVTNIGGSGTLADWTITVAGTRGAKGDTGASGAGSGDLLAANNLSDLANAATARGNLGLGTANSPQFTGVEVGHASDTTVTRASAGDIAVEGNRIFRVGGADVPIADGGTGASTAADAATALGVGTGDSPQFAGVNIGHASDTTVTRASAGNIAVEGNLLYRAGGIDVPVTDGGTGASTAEAARSNLGAAAVPTTSEFPVGFCGFMRYTGGTSLSNGSTTSGANVQTPGWTGTFGTTGLTVRTGAAQTGTWKNVAGFSLSGSGDQGNQFGLMVRTA
jgi:hypothetical protein